MKPPRTFKCGNREYTIVLESDPDSPEGESVWGYLDAAEHQLVLDADMQPHQMAEILIHELLHAVYNDYPLNVRPEKPGEGEEFLVGIGSRGLVELFRRNPKLFAWWLYLMST